MLSARSYSKHIRAVYESYSARAIRMKIIVKCPKCGNRWILDSNAADRRIRCRKCNRLFKVPQLDELPKAVKVLNSAKGPIYVDQEGHTYG